MNPPAISPESAADLVARLQHHPHLYSQMAALLDEVENRAGALNTGDEAQDAIVERMRQFGREALSGWAQRRHAEVQPARTPGVRQVGKKTLVADDAGPGRTRGATLAVRAAHAAAVLHRGEGARAGQFTPLATRAD